MLAVLFLVMSFSVYGQIDSTSDTGSVFITPPKPADTSVLLVNERYNAMLRRGGGATMRVAISGTAVDTTRIWKKIATRINQNGKIYIVDSVEVLVKLVVNRVYYH